LFFIAVSTAANWSVTTTRSPVRVKSSILTVLGA
jgi:hypothetical protein